MGQRWARWVFQLGLHIQGQLPSTSLAVAVSFHQWFSTCALWMQVCPWDISQSVMDHQKKTCLLTTCLSTSQPCFTNLFQNGVYHLDIFLPPWHFWDSQPSTSLSGSSTAARKDLRSPVTSMDSQSVSGPLPPLSTPWAKCS